MSLRQYLILIACGSTIGFVTWLVVLFNVDPLESGMIGFLFFYASLAVTVIGIASLVGFGVRMLLYKHDEIVLREVTTAFRQACLFTVLVVGSLFLESKSLLSWWNSLIFIAGISVLEMFFISSRFSR